MDEKENRGTGPHQVKLEKWIDCAPFERLLNLNIVEAADGRAVLNMPFLYEYAQGAGLMHGGALVTLADTAVVMAIKSLLPPGTHFATIRMANEFLYPVTQGVVTAEARVSRREGRIIEGSAVVRNGDGREVMRFSSEFKLAKGASAA